MSFTYDRTIASFVLAVVILIAVFAALTRADRYMELKAIHDCGMVARYTETNEASGSAYTYPLGDQYQACLEAKGYK